MPKTIRRRVLDELHLMCTVAYLTIAFFWCTGLGDFFARYGSPPSARYTVSDAMIGTLFVVAINVLVVLVDCLRARRKLGHRAVPW